MLNEINLPTDQIAVLVICLILLVVFLTSKPIPFKGSQKPQEARRAILNEGEYNSTPKLKNANAGALIWVNGRGC